MSLAALLTDGGVGGTTTEGPTSAIPGEGGDGSAGCQWTVID